MSTRLPTQFAPQNATLNAISTHALPAAIDGTRVFTKMASQGADNALVIEGEAHSSEPLPLYLYGEADALLADSATQSALTKAPMSLWHLPDTCLPAPNCQATQTLARICDCVVLSYSQALSWLALNDDPTSPTDAWDWLAPLLDGGVSAVLVLNVPSTRFGQTALFYGTAHPMGNGFQISLPKGAFNTHQLCWHWLANWQYYQQPLQLESSPDQRIQVKQRSLAPCYDALATAVFQQDGQWPQVSTAREQNGAFKHVGALGLYGIVDTLEWLDDLLTRGIDTLQWRVKDRPRDSHFKQQLQTAIQRCQQANVPLYINDDWQLAIEYGAYGVHLGQEDVTDANVSRIQEAGLALGISTHSPWEVCRAKTFQPSYIAFGPVHTPLSKELKYAPLGYEVVTHFRQQLEHTCALTCIGGITQDNIAHIAETGISSAAIVTALSPQYVEQHYSVLRRYYGAHK